MEDEAKWGTERKKFAEGVVRDVVAGRGGVIRKGAFAGGLAWGRRWLGGWVMVSSSDYMTFRFSHFCHCCLIC